MTASAESFSMGEKQLVLGTTKYSMEVKSAAVVARSMTLNETNDIAGTYVGAAVTEDPVNSAGTVVIASSESGYTVKGAHLGLPDATVNATFADGKLTIPAGQQVYKHSTYGPASLFAIDEEDNLNDLVFTLQEDGSLTLDPTHEVAMLLTTGTYAGYALGDTYDNYAYMPANGTITFDAYSNTTTPKDPATETYTSSVQLNLDGEGNVTSGVVYGFDDMTWLPFTVEADNKVQFSNDKVYYYSSSYGLAFATDLNDEGKFYTNVGPTGTINPTAGTITMPQWSFMLPNAAGTTYYLLNSLKKNCVITFPALTPTAINAVNAKAEKVGMFVENGQIVIERNGMKFNVAGQVIK